jgi:hypothetical protein
MYVRIWLSLFTRALSTSIWNLNGDFSAGFGVVDKKTNKEQCKLESVHLTHIQFHSPRIAKSCIAQRTRVSPARKLEKYRF